MRCAPRWTIACLLLLPACLVSGVGRASADEDPFDGLVALYGTLGLPLPPEGARLVRVDIGESPRWMLAFVVREAEGEKPAELLIGTVRSEIRQPGVVLTALDAGADIPAGFNPEWYEPVFAINAGVTTAIQCKARGWDRLARPILDASLRARAGHPHSAFYAPPGLPPRTALARAAWAHWANEILEPDTNRVLIARRMRELLVVEPQLDTDRVRPFLEALEASFRPSTAPAGSAEALIDDLVNLSYRRRKGADREPEPQDAALARLGFAAVPALIEHLDDPRLTRSVRTGFNNFPTYHLRVGEVVSDLLQGLAGEELGRDWLERQKGWGVGKEAARAWWEQARAQGEETYLTAHALPEGEWPAADIVRLLGAKYPRRLAEVYTTLLDTRPAMQSWPVADALAGGDLPREEKIGLFRRAARHENLEHRRAALHELKDLDPAAFVTHLLETLDGLPRTPRDSYWHCREASFANLVLETDDPRAWAKLREVALRSDIGLRMQLMSPMNYAYVGPRRRRQRLEFLAAFLDDAAVRRKGGASKMFDGPCAAAEFSRIEVRNFAAMSMASILDLPDEPQSGWTADQWSALRAKVAEAWGKERGD